MNTNKPTGRIKGIIQAARDAAKKVTLPLLSAVAFASSPAVVPHAQPVHQAVRVSPAVALNSTQLTEIGTDLKKPQFIEMAKGGNMAALGFDANAAFSVAQYKPVEAIMIQGKKYETVGLQAIALESMGDKFVSLQGDPNFMKDVKVGSYKVSSPSLRLG